MEVRYTKYRFVRTGALAAKPTLDFGAQLVVGEGPFREPPTVMQPTVFPSTSAADKIGSQFCHRKRLQKDLSFDHADARGIKRLQRLRKVEAEMRSADAVVRTMRG